MTTEHLKDIVSRYTVDYPIETYPGVIAVNLTEDVYDVYMEHCKTNELEMYRMNEAKMEECRLMHTA